MKIYSFQQILSSINIGTILLISILLFAPALSSAQNNQQTLNIFNALQYGAVGDGKTLDTEPIQKAIDEAAKVGKGSQVLIPSGHKYLVGTLKLKSGIDFHLQGNAELLVSTNQKDYTGLAAIVANETDGLSISGTGSINGRAMEFMSHYDKTIEWWIPKEWRPKIFSLTKCNNLKVSDITINRAPLWSLHMLGCENVLIDGIKINNDLDVPNCDGIDPDHCRNVEIRNCQITCGDDPIVIKATRQNENYGPSYNINVHDCILETQDSGLKIGTETTQDIHNIVFERCTIKTSCRGLTIQLRDEGNVFDVVFKDITFTSRYHSAPWWGRGEAISFTAIPRTPETKIGSIHDIQVINVTGTSENSIRINGTKESRISNISFDNVNVNLYRWTDYPGNLFDNRPTKVYEEIETHNTPGFYIRFSDQVILKDCSISWGNNIPDYFSNAIKAHDVTGLEIKNFKGESAHPDRDQAIFIIEN
ncbi:MAG: glycoside hydrolase [Ignavibacteriales bacterium]|nr:glycoside hydrolase [Ignavibacteriales bacterium]